MHGKYVSAVIVAGGSGSRMGTSTPKQYMSVCGKPVISHSLEKFQACDMLDEIIVVISEGMETFFREKILDGNAFTKISKVVAGGSERQQSVYNGLKCVAENADVVLIHDAARPLVKISDIEKLIKGTFVYDSCVLGVSAKDTIKIVDKDGFVINTPDRGSLCNIQTPQAFKYNIIIKAHEIADKESFKGTDDSMLVENLGVKTKIIEGSNDNIKITTSDDLIIAEALYRENII